MWWALGVIFLWALPLGIWLFVKNKWWEFCVEKALFHEGPHSDVKAVTKRTKELFRSSFCFSDEGFATMVFMTIPIVSWMILLIEANVGWKKVIVPVFNLAERESKEQKKVREYMVKQGLLNAVPENAISLCRTTGVPETAISRCRITGEEEKEKVNAR